MKKIFMATMVAATALFSACNGGSPRANMKTDVDTISYEMGMVMSAEEGEFQNMLSQQGSDSAYVDEFLKGYMAGMTSVDDKKQLAYNLGLQAGMQIKMQLPVIENQVFQGDSTKNVSLKNFIAGFNDMAKGKVALTVDGKVMDKQEANKKVMEYMFNKQKKSSIEFMEKKAKEAGVKKLVDGVYYKVVTPSQSTERCTASDKVIVKYEGSLPDGRMFDSSANQENGQTTIDLNNVIKGWQAAIPQMPIGSTWEIYLDSENGYGDKGSGPIPPFSALIFKITLVGVAK